MKTCENCKHGYWHKAEPFIEVLVCGLKSDGNYLILRKIGNDNCEQFEKKEEQ